MKTTNPHTTMTNKNLQNLLKTHPEEIKVGETYNVRMLITRKNDTDFRAIPMTKPCVHCAVEHVFALDEIAAFSPISPANGIKNAEPAPKHDPCRPFRAGDIVEPCQVKGRWLSEEWKNRKGIHYKVTLGEIDGCGMWVLDPDSLHQKHVEAVFFQLVTPVEEMEPYSVHENEYSKSAEVRRGNPVRVCSAYYWGGESPAYTKTQARASAQTECDRLNKQYQEEYEQALSHE